MAHSGGISARHPAGGGGSGSGGTQAPSGAGRPHDSGTQAPASLAPHHPASGSGGTTAPAHGGGGVGTAHPAVKPHPPHIAPARPVAPPHVPVAPAPAPSAPAAAAPPANPVSSTPAVNNPSDPRPHLRPPHQQPGDPHNSGGNSNTGGLTPSPITPPGAAPAPGVPATPVSSVHSGGFSRGKGGSVKIPHTRSGGISPASSVSANPVASGGAYTVVAGDTMWDIAQAHNMSLAQLEALNPQIKNPSLIFPGQQINIGDGGGIAPAKNSSSASSAHAATGFTAAAPHGHSPAAVPPAGTTISPSSPPSPIPTPAPAPGDPHNNGLGDRNNGGPRNSGMGDRNNGGAPMPQVPQHIPGGAYYQSPAQERIDMAHGRPLGSGGMSNNGALRDPAIHPPLNRPPFGGMGPKKGSFPTGSSYPAADTPRDRARGLGVRPTGWGTAGNSSPDPAQRAVYVAGSRDTNPLHINDSGHGHAPRS